MYFFPSDIFPPNILFFYSSAMIIFQIFHYSDSNGIRTHSHLVCKRTLNHLASLAKWLNVRLQTKWIWIRIPLLSLKLEIWRLLRARSFVIFSQTIECRFTLKLLRYMIITCRHFITIFVTYILS